MKWMRISRVAVFAGAAISMTGCCDQVCDALDDLNAHIAFAYAGCCQVGGDGWGQCVQNAVTQTNQLRLILIQAEAACRSGQDELVEELIRDFYQILRGRLVEGIGPTALRSDGAIVNTYKVLDPTDTVSITMSATPIGAAQASIQTVSVAGITYLSTASGTAIEAHGQIHPSEPLPAAVAQPMPVGGVTVDHLAFSGGQLEVQTGIVQATLAVRAGTLSVVEIDDNEPRLVPTAFSLDLDGPLAKARVQLDPSCPYNGLFIDQNGQGSLRVAVTFQSPVEALSRFVNLGSFWMVLPVEQQPDGSLNFDTDGPASGTTIFPVQDSTLAILLGNVDPAGVPNGQEKACADSDNNDIRDGADELININNTYAEDCP